MPDVPKYDGTSGTWEHITAYTMAVKGNNLAGHEIESVLLKKFGETLTRGGLAWYSLLPEHSIDSFQMLADSFIKAHAGGRKEILLEFQVTTWADIRNLYESKIRIEDDQVGFTSSTKVREKNRETLKDYYDMDRRSSKGQFLPYERTEGCGKGSRIADRFVVDKMTDRGRNNRSLQTGDCRHLVEEVKTLLKNGHLRELLSELLSDRTKNNYGRNRDNVEPSKAGEDPPCQTINMIFGGNEINGFTFWATKKIKVSITHNKRLGEDDITFTEEDADGLLLPHNDALVISLNVLDFKIKRVLVDPESSANIIQWRVLEQAKLTGSIIPNTKLLAGFNLASVTTRGQILLLKNAE
ncbi:PREDICTED: uncharacterized protein LOC109207578 [Nicotiana attenuata]|uniref:uncharacterized protein LOC109207578 n=1 Tax=Nicotiana attenuata TaxID=49451 RepID=UPI000905BC16|nr:PREDICTED: uncharacterized protein LOC109207578 [Nicotiana attenuata]